MIELKNKKVSLRFDEVSGCIDSLTDGKKEYVGEKVPVFKLGLMDQAGEQNQRSFEGFKLEHCEETEKLNTYSEKLYCDLELQHCEVQKTGFCAVYGDPTAEVTIWAELGENLQWRIKVERKDDLVTEWVDFPRIAVPDDLKDHNGKAKLLWGFNEGGIVDDLTYKEEGSFPCREFQYPSNSSIPMYPAMVESQFVAYYDEVTGLYFGAHDKEDHVKGIDFERLQSGILLRMRHFTGAEFGGTYEMNFPMVMEFFEGSWEDAAEIYRKWMKQERAERFIPISENPALPDWYGESPVVITYPVRGRHDGDIMNPNKLFPYMEGMKYVEQLERELNSKIMVILMHWEGTAPWAPPYVWPPFGGEAALKEFIDALHERGDVLGVYCSGMGWTQYSKRVDDYNCEAEFEEKQLRSVMCLSPKQELPYCAIVPDIRAGYDMCPTQEFTAAVLKDQVKHMVDASIDYIQLMDQNHGGTSYFCYSRDHGHAPVPGKWQVDAVKKLLSEINGQTGKVLLGCESAAAESYIPYLLFSDNRFELNYGSGQPVPLYAYLYHEYVNNFMGNQVSTQGWLDHGRSPENALERLAYSFMAGDMLTLVLNENGKITWNWGWRELEDIPDQESILTFVRNANQWRSGRGKAYLHDGKMVKPYPVTSGTCSMYGPKGHEFVLDRIHTCAWESRSGSYGQFLINCHKAEESCEILLPEGSYRLLRGNGEEEILHGGRQTICVERLSVVLVEKL